MKKKVIVDVGGGSGERTIQLAKRNPDADVYVIDDFSLRKDYRLKFQKNLSSSGLSNVHLVEGSINRPESYDFLKGRRISEVEMNFLHGGVSTIPAPLLEKMGANSRITVRMDASYDFTVREPFNKHFEEEVERLKALGFRTVVKKSRE